MKLELSGRTAVVTGGTRGIGAAIASAFAEEGVSCALLGRSADSLERLVSETGTVALPIAVDLSDPRAITPAFDRVRAQLGPIDILVNNAGASSFGDFDTVDDVDWTDAFELKLMGYVRCIRAVLPDMRQRGSGRIVNIVGAAGRSATTDYVLGAFNAALLHLTKTLGDLLAPSGIHVMAVNPGLTATDRFATMLESAAETGSSVVRERLSSIPIGRPASPEEIARIVMVLCSEVGILSSGSAFQADGGGPLGVF